MEPFSPQLPRSARGARTFAGANAATTPHKFLLGISSPPGYRSSSRCVCSPHISFASVKITVRPGGAYFSGLRTFSGRRALAPRARVSTGERPQNASVLLGTPLVCPTGLQALPNRFFSLKMPARSAPHALRHRPRAPLADRAVLEAQAQLSAPCGWRARRSERRVAGRPRGPARTRPCARPRQHMHASAYAQSACAAAPCSASCDAETVCASAWHSSATHASRAELTPAY